MIFPWRFKISPHQKTPGRHHHLPTDLLPPFFRVAPPIAKARYLTLCPENSPAPQPKPARLSPNARVVGIPKLFIEVSVTESWWKKKHPREMGDENEKKALWKMSFRFVLGSWRSRSGV